MSAVVGSVAELDWHSEWAECEDHALALLAHCPPDVLILALGESPESEAARWCGRMDALDRRPAILIVTARSSIQLAVHAERLGAVGVLTRPVAPEQIVAAVQRATTPPAGRRVPLPEVSAEPVGTEHLVGQSCCMARVRRMIARLAPCNTTVLILGESGTGKELIARALHEYGPRARAPFVAINCAAMPETLLEGELFGHEKGAYTGAATRVPGRFERAHGGTLFLDEIADMSPALQAKILRVLQERRVERLGGTSSVPVDVRLVAASNRDLLAAVQRGAFREDLYYRLAVVTLQLPSLADRSDDIVLLASHYVRRFAAMHGKPIRYICERALLSLRTRPWPGNVRELRNVIERAVLLVPGDTLRLQDLSGDEWTTEPAEVAQRDGVEQLTLDQVEARHIASVLRNVNGSVTDAARVLGIHRNSLARKIRRYGLGAVDIPANEHGGYAPASLSGPDAAAYADAP